MMMITMMMMITVAASILLHSLGLYVIFLLAHVCGSMKSFNVSYISELLLVWWF
jgi:hypothetical protein